MLWSQAIQYGNHLGLRHVGDGNRLGQRTGIRIEPAAMHVEENSILFVCRNHEGSDHAHGHASKGLHRHVDGIEGAPLFSCARLPCVGLAATICQRAMSGHIRNLSRKGLLRLGTDCGRNGNHTRDVRGSVRINQAAVSLRRLRCRNSFGKQQAASKEDECRRA